MTDYAAGAVLLIDKPHGWTSFDVVKKLRYALKVKIGHAGTLDPLATGLLVLCTGKMTKQIETYQAQEKEYEGTFYLGQTRPSADLETEPDATYDISHLNEARVRAATAQFTGEIDQVPPLFSAVKQGGERLYEKARRGETATVPPRRVQISTFEITAVALPEVHFRVVCSKGTYIRSLARDFGAALGAGAYLAALRRTRIGALRVADAHELLPFVAEIKNQRS